MITSSVVCHRFHQRSLASSEHGPCHTEDHVWADFRHLFENKLPQSRRWFRLSSVHLLLYYYSPPEVGRSNIWSLVPVCVIQRPENFASSHSRGAVILLRDTGVIGQGKSWLLLQQLHIAQLRDSSMPHQAISSGPCRVTAMFQWGL